MAAMVSNPLDAPCQRHFQELAQQSLLDQQQLEQDCDGSFIEYLENYFAQPI